MDKSEALRLADRLEGRWALHPEMQEAAAELRRRHSEHEEDQSVIAVWRGRTQRAEAQRDLLLEACKRALRYSENVGIAEGVLFDDDKDLPAIQAAIKAVEDAK